MSLSKMGQTAYAAEITHRLRPQPFRSDPPCRAIRTFGTSLPWHILGKICPARRRWLGLQAVQGAASASTIATAPLVFGMIDLTPELKTPDAHILFAVVDVVEDVRLKLPSLPARWNLCCPNINPVGSPMGSVSGRRRLDLNQQFSRHDRYNSAEGQYSDGMV